MRSFVVRTLLRFSYPFAFLLLCAHAPAAGALTIPLNVEFDEGAIGPHATLTVEESGGGLDFELDLAGTDLGPNADLHEFYFNLAGDFTNLQLSSTQSVNTPFELVESPSVAGGAGADFDWGVDFGSGAGPAGNGTLQTATFRLTADEPLSLASLAELSETSAGIQVNFALHVQSTSTPGGSETVGGVIPEPGTALLVGSGLAGLLGFGRRRTQG